MDLCIDVGNTTFVVGVYKKRKLIKKDFFLVDSNMDDDQYEVLLLSLLGNHGVNPDKINRIIYSSVVPDVDKKILPRLNNIFSCPIKRVKECQFDIQFGQIDVNEVGDDLLAALEGAKKKYGCPTIIADLGTASKVLLLDKNGVFDSCLIIPGLSMSIASLSKQAALLPEINLKVPSSVLAHNTIEAMNNGVILGHAEMLKGLINRIEKEIGYHCQRILTGGSSIYLKELLKDEFLYDGDLCVDGLEQLLGEENE